MSEDGDYRSRTGATSRDDNSRDDGKQRYGSRSGRNYSRTDRMNEGDYRSRGATSSDDLRQGNGFRNERNYSRADRNQNWRRSDDISTGNHTQAANHDPFLRLGNANRNVSLEDTIKYFIPRYHNIREDRSIMENYRNNLRYVGDYSDDSKGKYSHEHIGFRFLKTEFRPDDRTKVKEVNFDLNVSMDKAVEFTKHGHFDGYLKCITQEPEVLSSLKRDPDGKSEVKFLMTYYTLIQILQMPYLLKHLDKDIPLGACLKSGVIYMYMTHNLNMDTVIDLNKTLADNDPNCKSNEAEGNDRSEDSNEAGTRNEEHPIHNWSHKFKQYMCNEDVTKGTIPNEAFRIVVASKLGPFDVLVNPTTDCLNPDVYKGERDLSAFVKLYTTRCPPYSINRRKCYEWVVPMIVGGTEEMIAGYCNESGIASEVRSYTVDDLIDRGKGYWNLDKNFTFAVDFLDFVKKQTLSNPGVDIFFMKNEGESFLTCQKFFPVLVVKKKETHPKRMKMTMKFQYNWFSDVVKNA